MTKNRKASSTVATNLSATHDELFIGGVPATIDNPDHGKQGGAPQILDALDLETSIRYGKRAGLLRHWLELPGVTLEQATWLLLGRDPFDPHSNEPDSPTSNLLLQFKTLLNMLECEVTSARLRLTGKNFAGILPRFHFPDVVASAKRLGMARSVVAQMEELARFEKQGRSIELPDETKRINQRYAVNRAVVDKIRATTPEGVTQIPAAAPKASRKRKLPTQQVNVSIRIGLNEYINLFDSLYPSVVGEGQTHGITDQMHKDDRAELNIKLVRGRRRSAQRF